jgi:hypothetical protein
VRKTWVDVVHTSGATVISVAIGALSVALTARVLGPEGRGLYAAATSWASLFATFGSLSLGQVVIHRVAGREPSDWYGDVTGTLLALCVALTLGGWGSPPRCTCSLGARCSRTSRRRCSRWPWHRCRSRSGRTPGAICSMR